MDMKMNRRSALKAGIGLGSIAMAGMMGNDLMGSTKGGPNPSDKANSCF